MGRADPNEGWGATVFVQVIDPQAFGGTEAFARQTDWLLDACHDATPREGVERVRVAVTGFGNKPLRAIALEETLIGKPADAESISVAASRIETAGEEGTGSAGAYKAHLARVCAEQALQKAVERAR